MDTEEEVENWLSELDGGRGALAIGPQSSFDCMGEASALSYGIFHLRCIQQMDSFPCM